MKILRNKTGIAVVLVMCIVVTGLFILHMKVKKGLPENAEEEQFDVALTQEQEEEYKEIYKEEYEKEYKTIKWECPGLTFLEGWRLSSEIPDELEIILGDALLNDEVEEFIAENEISYRILSIEEQKEYAEKDCEGVLKTFLHSTSDNTDDLWFLFLESETIFVRRPLENNTFVYYGFWVDKEDECFSYLPAMRALGLEEDYFFIKYEEKEYFVTTKRNEGKIIGIATYCMNGEFLYGGVLYQEKTSEGDLMTKYWGYTTHGEKHSATYWPEY